MLASRYHVTALHSRRACLTVCMLHVSSALESACLCASTQCHCLWKGLAAMLRAMSSACCMSIKCCLHQAHTLSQLRLQAPPGHVAPNSAIDLPLRWGPASAQGISNGPSGSTGEAGRSSQTKAAGKAVSKAPKGASGKVWCTVWPGVLDSSSVGLDFHLPVPGAARGGCLLRSAARP